MAVANVKKALAQGRVDYLFGESTGMIQAISPENNSTYKILMTSGSFASELADEKNFPYHFVTGATYGAQLQMLVDYIKSSSGSTPAKVVIVHSSTSMGRDGIEPAIKRAEELGIKIVLVQQTKFVETDVSAYALAIRKAQPTHVIHHGYSFAVWPEIVRLVRDYGMNDVVFLGTVWQNERAKMRRDEGHRRGSGRRQSLERRHIKPAGPMMKTIGELNKAREPNFNGYARLGFLNAWMSSMMANARLRGGYRRRSASQWRQSRKRHAIAIKNWDTGGLIDVPVSIAGQQVGLGRIIKWSKNNNWDPSSSPTG